MKGKMMIELNAGHWIDPSKIISMRVSPAPAGCWGANTKSPLHLELDGGRMGISIISEFTTDMGAMSKALDILTAQLEKKRESYHQGKTPDA